MDESARDSCGIENRQTAAENCTHLENEVCGDQRSMMGCENTRGRRDVYKRQDVPKVQEVQEVALGTKIILF